MGYLAIKNKKGTADKTPPTDASSWLDFWEKKKGKKANICEVKGCMEDPEVGGHVIKSGEGSKEYILPMCYGCNNKPDDESFQVWEIDLISVK